ncbi:VOC family protein [Haliea sp. E17]|uniref:VOC family protein n=1 Tax=Haliea sp. E17 TaxID=3401576 RepID=UPI003AAEF7AE
MQIANPLNLSQIDHVVIRARDMQRMIVFYRDVLGCRLERGPGELGLAQLRAGNSLIDLVDVSGPLGLQGGAAPDGRAPNMDHVCFQVEPWDAGEILDYLHHHGVETGEVEVRYGATGMGPSIYLRDPEGNNLELKGKG